jgi:hypothetical protein
MTARRPWWMTGLLVLCLYMAAVRVPLDFLTTPIARDEEVWLGIVLRGGLAKATEPLHAAIYAAGAYGFWRMRSWMWPWAAVYAAQVAVGTLVWNAVDPRGRGWIAVPVAIAMLVPAIALWRSRAAFER